MQFFFNHYLPRRTNIIIIGKQHLKREKLRDFELILQNCVIMNPKSPVYNIPLFARHPCFSRSSPKLFLTLLPYKETAKHISISF